MWTPEPLRWLAICDALRSREVRLRRHLGQEKRIFSGDEACGTTAEKVIPTPLHQDQQTVVELHQVEEVDEQPQQPGQEARNVHPTQVGNRSGSADRGERRANSPKAPSTCSHA